MALLDVTEHLSTVMKWAALLYAPGALLFTWARRERGLAVFKGLEWALLAALLALAAAAAVALANGSIKL